MNFYQYDSSRTRPQYHDKYPLREPSQVFPKNTRQAETIKLIGFLIPILTSQHFVFVYRDELEDSQRQVSDLEAKLRRVFSAETFNFSSIISIKEYTVFDRLSVPLRLSASLEQEI